MSTQTLEHVETPAPAAPRSELVALMAEFPDIDAIFAGANAVRRAGYLRWDVHSPFPIHGIDAAMGTRPTVLPWITLGGGLAGMLTGIVYQCWTMGWDYKFLISGKPYISMPAFIPIIFELTVLFAALATVFGMFGLNKLPMLFNPVFKHSRFRRATSDRFFILIDSSDPKFNAETTEKLLRDAGATAVERVEDEIE